MHSCVKGGASMAVPLILAYPAGTPSCASAAPARHGKHCWQERPVLKRAPRMRKLVTPRAALDATKDSGMQKRGRLASQRSGQMKLASQRKQTCMRVRPRPGGPPAPHQQPLSCCLCPSVVSGWWRAPAGGRARGVPLPRRRRRAPRRRRLAPAPGRRRVAPAARRRRGAAVAPHGAARGGAAAVARRRPAAAGRGWGVSRGRRLLPALPKEPPAQ